MSEVESAGRIVNEELWAVEAVCAVTGASHEKFDRDGRQGAVDFLLRYSDHRTGALEVTSHASPRSREVYALLSRERFQWPNPGSWSWSLAVASDANLKRLRKHYPHVIQTCESHGVTAPSDLPFALLDRDPVLWGAAFEEMGARFRGHGPTGTRDAHVLVIPEAVAGGVDDELVHLSCVITELLQVPGVVAHLAKLLRHDASEHHLFLTLGAGAIPFPQYYVLCGAPTRLPADSPEVPRGVSHLWFATGYGPTLLGWTERSGWAAHEVFSAEQDLT